MTSAEALGERIDRMVASSPYSAPPEERSLALLEMLKDELEYTCERSSALRNYVRHWPVDVRLAQRIADLPYLPVRLLKAQPPLSLVEPGEIKRTLMSSATTGQLPSRVVLDSATARRMTKGIIVIVSDFIGSSRRPYLVVDVPGSVRGRAELGARGAAIQSLQPFASSATYCLNQSSHGELTLDLEKVLEFADNHRESPILVYGFTYILWNHLVKPLIAKDIRVDMPRVRILHSGGWKRLQDESVDKRTFNEGLARVFGCRTDDVIDFYGLIENVGIIYPDCPAGNKHVPAFGDVIVRNPLTLEPVEIGEQGLVQVCSVLPTSFPGHLLLTEDMAEVVADDGCPCGRRGLCFHFVGRVEKAEIRGCGNIERQRVSGRLRDL
jgi:hypothetical protein